MDVKPSLAAALREDPRARDRFVKEYRTWAIDYARHRGAGQDAEDIAHAALLTVIERPPDALDRVHPRAVISVKIRDLVVLRWREQQRAPLELHPGRAPEPGPGVSTLVWLRRLLRKMSGALQRLAPGERELLERRYLEGERAVDMAGEAETAAAVRGKVFRALDSLRDEMEPKTLQS